MEDQPIQQEINEELEDETSEFNGMQEVSNLELNENNEESIEYFQNERKSNELLDSKPSIQESKISNIIEANTSNEKLYVKIRNENGIYKEKIDPNNFYEMLSYELYRSNRIERDYPIDLCLDIQEDIDNILPFLQKSIINRKK
ncbi:hypothetical protein ChUKH1_11130 [Cryptosporidium hominis]|uniref:Uncharacterized protein n=1 Tax=Cryptosporidium hominis TaxID=237895 RepID=A0ABX5BFM7_CRYHO|nr:hypothetical protein ChTU502y2012_408g0290 [Cryptosporidium hominis]PPA63076.1 hypothetical protein ChUKH1_11130 [Cryptosporidium hominis]PPS96319.1 Uncharacterized protein GY17_00001807 [Cryptosporidium hominis]|eukprot:PPS96319.1 Uncharacterized protein GY17_00001807 [Cryptosporidium hominis]